MESKVKRIKVYNRIDGTSFYRKTIRINGKKTEKTFTRKVDADKWYSEKKREKELVERGLSVHENNLTVADFTNEWHQKRKDNGKPFSSWSSDDGRLKKWVLPRFSDREMGRISMVEWEMFLDGLVSEKDLSPATRNRIRSLVTKMYNDGIRQGRFSHNPVSLIPKLKESMEAWDYWSSVDDIIAYLEEAKKESDWFFIFAAMALNAGPRLGEVLALDLGDMNLSHRRFNISKVFEEASGIVFTRTKGHKERWLGINDSLFEVLLDYRNRTKFKSSTDPLICDQEGKRLYERHVRRVHERVCAKAKVKPIRIHDLRHTYASHYIMNGGSLAELQGLLGHSSPMMTLKYAHLAPGFLEKKAGVVSFSVSKNNVVELRKLR